ncbi:MAG: ATP-binding protein [Fusobacteriota bacterium]
MEKFETKAIMDNLEDMIQFVLENVSKRVEDDKKLKNKIRLACEEVFVNIINYAYGDETGDIEIYYEDDLENNTFTIIVEDSGVEFDPFKREDPDIDLPMEERTIGGLGIFMVKNIMDDVEYKRKDGKNILKMVKGL